MFSQIIEYKIKIVWSYALKNVTTVVGLHLQLQFKMRVWPYLVRKLYANRQYKYRMMIYFQLL